MLHPGLGYNGIPMGISSIRVAPNRGNPRTKTGRRGANAGRAREGLRVERRRRSFAVKPGPQAIVGRLPAPARGRQGRLSVSKTSRSDFRAQGDDPRLPDDPILEFDRSA
jgi:hypothetical protein